MFLLMEDWSPLSSDIIATTVKTPIMMPSSVSPARSRWAPSAPRARPRSSRRACTAPASLARTPSLSLIAQGLDGVERRRRERGPEAEDRAEEAGAEDAARDHPRIDAGGHGAHEIDERRRARAEG